MRERTPSGVTKRVERPPLEVALGQTEALFVLADELDVGGGL